MNELALDVNDQIVFDKVGFRCISLVGIVWKNITWVIYEIPYNPAQPGPGRKTVREVSTAVRLIRVEYNGLRCDKWQHPRFPKTHAFSMQRSDLLLSVTYKNK